MLEPLGVPQRRHVDPGRRRRRTRRRARCGRSPSRRSTPTGRVRLCTDDDGAETQVVIPIVAFRFFVDVLAELANGNAVTVAPVHAELTTQQAADLLNVSRPYLIKLLDEERIPYRRVGNRRKVQLVDVLDYKRRDAARRKEILDELTREAEELGL